MSGILEQETVMGIVEAKNLTFEYIRRDEEGNVEGITTAVDNVNIDIKAGDFVAVLGHNGSGKSTFAKHLNALVMPTEGTVYVDGMDTKDSGNTLSIRQTAGMVFQNPDNQIVGTLVDEEVGFGPENIGVPTEEIWERVEKSLKAVGMYQFRNASPNKLSGGQKQRVAIAGIVAMKPKCIVLDEPTAMLDPLGRKEVLNVLHELNRKENVTIKGAAHIPPDYITVPELMEKLILNYKTWNIYHPIVKAALLHGELVKIHPFIDGNGRTSRLIMNLDLMNSGYNPIIIKKEDRLKYYEALDKAHTTRDYTDFVKLITKLEMVMLKKYLELL